MTIEKIQRVANPTQKKKKRRIKLSKKQIAAGFGGKRRKENPGKRRRAKNPGIMTLGYLNPERLKMRKTKKVTPRKQVSAAPRRRRKNPQPVVKHRRRYRRNPEFLGNGMEAIGILGGVAAQKFVKGFIPSSLSSGNAMVNVAVSVALAFGIGKVADMVAKGKPVGKGIALGALASAASDAINVFAPQLSPTIGLNGMGTYQNALFAVPENPIMRGLPAPSVPVAAKGMGGAMTAAFGNSF
jgi:hypothetical protein